jgi:hypothetical protein
VNAEADALAAIVRDSGAFEPADGDRVRRTVGAYVRAVVDDEWPRMHDGKDSARAWAAVDDMYAALQSVDASSPREASFYDDSVQQLNSALTARRDRLDDAVGGLPWVIAALLAVGSIIIVGYTVLIGSRSFWFHLIGAGSIALVLAFSLLVLLNLTYPFSGDLSVGPEPFRAGSLAPFLAASR